MPTPRPLPDLPGVYYARIMGTFGGRASTNIFTYRTSAAPAPGAGDLTLAQLVGDALAARWPGFANGGTATGYTCSEVRTYALHTPLAPHVSSAVTCSGSLSGPITSATTAWVVNHTVSRRGRGSQSRTSVSPVTAASITADGLNLTSTFRNATNTAYNTFLTEVLADLTASGTGVWDYVQLAKGTDLHPTPGTFVITASSVEIPLSTQRQRVRRA